MRAATLSLLLVFAGSVAAQDEPFCVVDSYGQRCSYYDAVTCRRDAEVSRGMCVPNPRAGQSGGRVFERMMDGVRMAEEGRRAGEQRAEHEARMKLLQAQAQAQAQASQQQCWTSTDGWARAAEMIHGKPWVITYQCALADGKPYLTKDASVGCVVYSME